MGKSASRFESFIRAQKTSVQFIHRTPPCKTLGHSLFARYPPPCIANSKPPVSATLRHGRRYSRQVLRYRRLQNCGKTTTASSFGRNLTGLWLQVAEVGEAEWRAQVFAQLQPVLFGDRQENLNNFGIELRAGAAADFFACVRQWQRFAIGAIADHGVKRVGDGENSRAQRNLLAFQAAGIAGPIEEFLVSENDFSGIAKER